MTDRINHSGAEFVCNCNRLTQPHGTPHKPWCNFLKPRPEVKRDPMRLASAVSELTGGRESWTPFGADYGQPPIGGGASTITEPGITMPDNRDRTRAPKIGELNAEVIGPPEPPAAPVARFSPAVSTIKRLVCVDILARGEQRGPESVPGEPDALHSAYDALLDAAMDLRRFLQQRDGR